MLFHTIFTPHRKKPFTPKFPLRRKPRSCYIRRTKRLRNDYREHIKKTDVEMYNMVLRLQWNQYDLSCTDFKTD